MPEPSGLSCRVQVRDGAIHLVAVGELDHRSRDVFDHTVHAELNCRPALLVLDLTAVTFLSPEGVAAVVDAAYHAVNAGWALVIRPSAEVERRLRSLGLTELLTAADSAQGRSADSEPSDRGSGPPRPAPQPVTTLYPVTRP